MSPSLRILSFKGYCCGFCVTAREVLVSAAWDETVTTGYKCSTCDATK